MLATLFFLALASISHVATVTISASDPSISLTPGWSQQFSQSAQNSYIQTDSLLCDLTATLPRLSIDLHRFPALIITLSFSDVCKLRRVQARGRFYLWLHSRLRR